MSAMPAALGSGFRRGDDREWSKFRGSIPVLAFITETR
jgi:hypothetical protein